MTSRRKQKWLLTDGTRVVTLRKKDGFTIIEPTGYKDMTVQEFRSWMWLCGGCEVIEFPPKSWECYESIEY